jgi:hypothetical protein
MARVADVEPGVGRHPTDVLFELVHRQEVEPQVLRATADGVADLLRIGGGEHEHDMGVGGSSSVLSSAASAAFDSMCTSSRMYTLWRPGVPSEAFSMRSRIASTPLLLAASSSWTS